jgi:hypothetical protein
MACGVVGGVLTLIAAVAALVTGGPDTAIVGAWVTVAAGCSGSPEAASRAAGPV